jgi:hypothetical protein
MISYNRLGSNGRLGNQMFQYAALRGIAALRGWTWYIPPADTYGDSNYGLFDCFEMSSVTPKNFKITDYSWKKPRFFNYDKFFCEKVEGPVNLHDYFQTEKYFKNIEKRILKDFTFKKNILEPCQEIVSQYENPIFIHVRRGDYVNQPDNHPVCPLSYYEKALKEFPEDVPVFVFSDDLDWCREHFTDDRFLISDGNMKYQHTSDTNDGRVQSWVPYYDLCMMSLCSGAIIANSSMSWWGAWLQEDRGKVVTPTPWFGKNYSELNLGDLIPQRWIKMEVE